MTGFPVELLRMSAMQTSDRGQVRDFTTSLRGSFPSPRRQGGALAVAARHLWYAAVRVYLAAFHQPEIHGRRHLPAAPPYVLAANHLSHLDALVLLRALPWRLWD